MFNAIPKIQQSKKKKNKRHTFLGFSLVVSSLELQRLVLIYLPILDILPLLNATTNNKFIT
jgi:hypothetical protein